MILKIKRVTKTGNHYSKKEGMVNKPTTKIKMTLFGLLNLKTIHRYQKEYNGSIVDVDKRHNPIIKEEDKKENTIEFLLENLNKISEVTKENKTKKIIEDVLDELVENDSYIN